MHGGRRATLYTAFAAVATLANLGAQALMHALLPPQNEGIGPSYWFALAIGTGVGLVVKYLLDKRWIFFDVSAGFAAHRRRFSLYTVTGLLTTAIFWGTQTAFFLLAGSQIMLYLGGALGLMVGYVVKYYLDRRFVFTFGEARA